MLNCSAQISVAEKVQAYQRNSISLCNNDVQYLTSLQISITLAFVKKKKKKEFEDSKCMLIWLK